MDEKDYLTQIRVLHKRENDKGKIAGVTTWGLLLAIVILLAHLFDNFVIIREDTIAIRAAVILFGHIQIALLSLMFLVIKLTDATQLSEFDNRIKKGQEAEDFPRIIVGIIAIAVLPLLSQLYADNGTALPPHSIVSYQIEINIITLWLLIGSVVAYGVAITIYEKYTGNPFPALVAQTTAKPGKILLAVNVSYYLLVLELVIGNGLAVFHIAGQIDTTLLKPVFSVSSSVFLVVFCFVFLTRKLGVVERLRRLESLERDVLFHNLKVEEIKKRMQDDLIGHEIGDWLKNKVIEVRNKSANLVEHYRAVDSFCEEIRKLDKNLVYERTGRIKNYVSELDSLFEEYDAEIFKLIKWLELLASQLRTKVVSTRINELLLEVRDELKEIATEVRDQSKDAMGKLREVTDDT